MNDNIGKQRLSHKQRLKKALLECKKAINSSIAGGRQVFQTLTPARWKRFVWMVRCVAGFVALCLISVALDLFLFPFFHTSDNEHFKKLLNPADNFIFRTEYNTDLEQVKSEIGDLSSSGFCADCIKPGKIQKTNIFHKKQHGKNIVLSFDDGPDPKYTAQILDILKKENIKATFYVVGLQVENNIALVQRIYEEGHEIGNHTFTHPNLGEVPVSRTFQELRATRRLLECILGSSTLLYRPPFSVSPPVDKIPVAHPDGPIYYNIVETIDPRDWEEGLTADSVFKRVLRMKQEGNILLLHDGGGPREATIKALPRIIRHFKDNGYTFISTAQYIGKTRDEVMPPVDNDMDAFLGWINRYLIVGIHKGDTIFRIIIITMILSILRNIGISILAAFQTRRAKKERADASPGDKVSIIVPAYNEEMNAVKTVENLLKSDYPDFEIIFIDDGSKDNTYRKVHEAFAGNAQVKVFTKPNGGKASSLNYGLLQARGEVIICIDADTQLKKDAVGELVKYFNDPRVGAVAGNVKVGNEKGALTKWQSIEYITSQNFDKRAFDLLNCITVIPGAIGAFRKEAIEKAGGFDTDTLAEDCEITMRLLQAGYRVRYNPKAIAVTEAPETLAMFLKQRLRWTFGIMQSFWKHRESAFNPGHKSLGFVAYPNMIIYQVIIPLFSPLADVLMVSAIILGNGSTLALYYLLYLLVDAFGAIIAFSFEKENVKKLLWLIPQRIIYRQLMFWVLLKSLIKAIKGEMMGWGFLKRTGNVKTLEA